MQTFSPRSPRKLTPSRTQVAPKSLPSPTASISGRVPTGNEAAGAAAAAPPQSPPSPSPGGAAPSRFTVPGSPVFVFGSAALLRARTRRDLGRERSGRRPRLLEHRRPLATLLQLRKRCVETRSEILRSAVDDDVAEALRIPGETKLAVLEVVRGDLRRLVDRRHEVLSVGLKVGVNLPIHEGR